MINGGYVTLWSAGKGNSKRVSGGEDQVELLQQVRRLCLVVTRADLIDARESFRSQYRYKKAVSLTLMRINHILTEEQFRRAWSSAADLPLVSSTS